MAVGVGERRKLISEISPNIVVFRPSLHTHFLPASDHTSGLILLKTEQYGVTERYRTMNTQ
jgi:hypothetical protein